MTPSAFRLAGFIVLTLFFLGVSPSTPLAAAPAEQAPVELPDKCEKTMQDAMDVVIRTLTEIEARAGLTLEEKQQLSMDFVRNYRWGLDCENYFWINDLQGRMLMHPITPQLEGEILINLRDVAGKLFFLEFINVSLEHGFGFVDYLWPGPTGEAPQPTTAMVHLFQPYGWVIGTGMLLETVEAYEEYLDPDFFIPLDDPDGDDRDPASPT